MKIREHEWIYCCDICNDSYCRWCYQSYPYGEEEKLQPCEEREVKQYIGFEGYEPQTIETNKPLTEEDFDKIIKNMEII